MNAFWDFQLAAFKTSSSLWENLKASEEAHALILWTLVESVKLSGFCYIIFPSRPDAVLVVKDLAYLKSLSPKIK